MLDLPTLGRELRSIRRGLRIPSAELARRVGVSPTYIWLIEQAKPRTSGEPSRPSEDLLRRWTAALGMSADDAQRIRELAGYFGSDVTFERDASPAASPRSSLHASFDLNQTRRSDPTEKERVRSMREPIEGRDTAKEELRRWAGINEATAAHTEIEKRIHDILRRAEINGRGDEVLALLDSFLSWLEYYASHES